jgi:hypothetical protein
MLSKSYIIPGILTAALIQAYRVNVKHKATIEELCETNTAFADCNEQLIEVSDKLAEDFTTAVGMNKYLIDLILRYDITVDEFDAIALNFHRNP